MRALKYLMGTAMLALAIGGVNAADDGTFTINIQGPQDSAATVSQGGGNDFQEAPLPQRQPTSNTRQRSRNTSASGTQQRQNTGAQSASNRQSNAAGTRSAQPRSASQAPAAAAQTATAAPAAAASSGSEGATRYNVRATDTLWSIATRHLPGDRSVNEFQIVASIYRNNPASFAQGNVNRLLGGTITIPPLSEIRREDPATGSRLLERGTLQMPALAPAAAVSTAQPASAAPESGNAQSSQSQSASQSSAAQESSDTQSASAAVPEFQATESVVQDARKQAQEEREQQDANALSASMGSAANRSTSDNEAAAAAAADAARAAADGAKVLGLSDNGKSSPDDSAFKMNGDEEQSEPLARLDNDTIKVMLQGSQKQIDLKMREIDRKLMQTIERMQKANETVTTSSDATVASLAKQYDGIIAGLQQTVTELKGQIAALDRDNTNMREMLLATDEKLESLQVKLADGKVGVSDSGDYQRSLTMIIVGIGLLSLLLLGLFVIFRIKSRARNRSVESELAEDVEDSSDLEDDTLLSSTVSSDSEGEDAVSEDQDAWNKAAAEAAAEASAGSDEPPEDPDDSKTAMEMWSKAINEQKKSESKSAEVGESGEGTEAGESTGSEAEASAADETAAEDTSAADGAGDAAAQEQEASSDEETMDDWAAALAEQEGASGGASAEDESAAAAETDAADLVSDVDSAIAVEERQEIEEPQIVPEVPESEQDLSKYIGDRGSEWVSEMDEKQPEPEEEPDPTPTPEELAAQAAAAMEEQKKAALDEDLKKYLGGSGSEWAKAVDVAQDQQDMPDITAEDVVSQARDEAAAQVEEDTAGAEAELSGEAAALSQALKDHAVPKADASAEDPVSADAESEGSVDEVQPSAAEPAADVNTATEPSYDELVASLMGDEAAPAPAEPSAPETHEEVPSEVSPDELLEQVQSETEDEAQPEISEIAAVADAEDLSAGVPDDIAGDALDGVAADVPAEAEADGETAADESVSEELPSEGDAVDADDEIIAAAADEAVSAELPAENDAVNSAGEITADPAAVGNEAEESVPDGDMPAELPATEPEDAAVEYASSDEAMLAEALAASASETQDEAPADEIPADGAAETSESVESPAVEDELPEGMVSDLEAPADSTADLVDSNESDAAGTENADVSANAAEDVPETGDEAAAVAEEAADEAVTDQDGAMSDEPSGESSEHSADELQLAADELQLAQSLEESAAEPAEDSDPLAADENVLPEPESGDETAEMQDENAVADEGDHGDEILSEENESPADDARQDVLDDELPGDDVVTLSGDESVSHGDPIADEFASMLSEAREEQSAEVPADDTADPLENAVGDMLESGSEAQDASAALEEYEAAEAEDEPISAEELESSSEVPAAEENADPEESAPDEVAGDELVEINLNDLPYEDLTGNAPAEDVQGNAEEVQSAPETAEFGAGDTAAETMNATLSEPESPDAESESLPELPSDPEPSSDTLPETLSGGVTVESETEDNEIPSEDSWERLESAAGDDDDASHADLSPFKWKVPEDDGFDGVMEQPEQTVSEAQVSPAEADGEGSAEENSILNMLGDSGDEKVEIADASENASGEMSERELMAMISPESSVSTAKTDGGDPADSQEEAAEPELTDEEYQYLSDSLGLARLYFETGDLEEARKILDLVEKRGNLGLRSDARALREEYDRF